MRELLIVPIGIEMRNKKRIGRLKTVNLILNFDIELCTVKGESKLNKV